MLAVAFAVVAVGAVVAVVDPVARALGTVVFLAMAAALGAGLGATFALVAQRATRARSARYRASSARPAGWAGSSRRW